MTPRTMRIAYQIYWLIQRTGGDCTVHDMAEATGASWQVCRNICMWKGWGDRYRNTGGLDTHTNRMPGGAPPTISHDFARAAGIEISGMVDA